jgi:MFS transporter, DHA2 family, multidrug resistance protein
VPKTIEPKSNSRWLLTASSVLAALLYAIDSTIVNVALPHIQGSLQATQDQTAWVITSYIVTSAICMPLAGWLGTRFGLRPVLLLSIAGFTIGSMLCGLATDLTEIVVFRMLQGSCGAALLPLVQVLLLQEYPREQHGRVTALWGMGVLVGPIIGPTLGGWLTDELSWRWAFYVNVPVGIVSYLGLLASAPKTPGDSRRPFDMTGFVLLSLALGLFQLMIDRGQTKDWFDSTEILAEAFFSAVALYMFIAHSLTHARPFVDLRLFRDRNYLISLALMFAIGAAVFSPTVLLPGFLQQLQGYSATQAGVLLAARGVASVVAMLLVGRLVDRIDIRIPMGIGVAAASLSLWMMGKFSVDTPAPIIVLSGLLQGFGPPLTFVPLTVAAFGTLSGGQRTEAGALLTLTRNLGASIGISAVVALLARSTQINTSYLGEHFTAYSTSRWQLIGADPGNNLTTATLIGEIRRQAAAIAYANDFNVMAALILLALPLVFAMKIQRRTKGTAELSAGGDH